MNNSKAILYGPLVAEWLYTYWIRKPSRGSNGAVLPYKLNGKELHSDDARSIRAWRDDEFRPTIWKVDRLLTKHGIHIQGLIDWADEMGYDLWPNGIPWWELPERQRAAA